MVKSIHQWPDIKCFGHCDRWDWIKKFEVQQNYFSTSSSISPMGDHNYPPKNGRRNPEGLRRKWKLGRHILEKIYSWKCNNESEWRQYQEEKGQMLGHGHDSCLWNKRQKAKNTWERWCSYSTWVSHSKQNVLNKIMSFKSLRKNGFKPKVQGQDTFSQKKVLLDTSKYFTLLNARQYH